MGLVKTRRRLAEDGSPHRAGAETAAREGGDDAADEEGYVAAVAIDADEMPG